jgi:hypothetical protein
MSRKIKILIIGVLVLAAGFVFIKFILAAGNDSYTVSLLHMNGTDGSTTFTDSAAGGTHTWTANGNAQIDTAQSKFNGASGLFDGTGDYLSAPDSNDWNFGSGDFTIDFWVRFNSVAANQYILSQQTGSDDGMAMQWVTANELQFRARQASINIIAIDKTWSPSANTWYHLAISRNGNNWRWFVDGTQLDTTVTETDSIPDWTGSFRVGYETTPTEYFLNGWLDELRISKGIARWTANFTPPVCDYDSECGPPPKVPDIMIFE